MRVDSSVGHAVIHQHDSVAVRVAWATSIAGPIAKCPPSDDLWLDRSNRVDEREKGVHSIEL